MGLFTWTEERMHKLKWYDMSLLKTAIIAFTLMIAKLWTPILSLTWYWYLVIFIVAAIVPYYKILKQ